MAAGHNMPLLHSLVEDSQGYDGRAPVPTCFVVILESSSSHQESSYCN